MKYEELFIITNNPLVKNINNIKTLFINGSDREVMQQGYCFLKNGHELLSHPLIGVNPQKSPYRTLIFNKNITSNNQANINNFCNYLIHFEQNSIASINQSYEKEENTEYQMLDKEMILNAIHSLNER